MALWTARKVSQELPFAVAPGALSYPMPQAALSCPLAAALGSLPPEYPPIPLVLLQGRRDPQGALARTELWAPLERGDLQAHRGLLAPLAPQPLLDHPTPGSLSTVSPSGSQQVWVGVG